MSLRKLKRGGFFHRKENDFSEMYMEIERILNQYGQALGVSHETYNEIMIAMCKAHPGMQKMIRTNNDAGFSSFMLLIYSSITEDAARDMVQHLILIPSVIADIIIKNAVRERKEMQLFETIDKCRRVILPQKFSYIQSKEINSVWYAATDVCSQMQHAILTGAIFYAIEGLLHKAYDLVFPNFTDARICEHRKELADLLNPLIPPQLKKKAVGIFTGRTGDFLGVCVKSLCASNEVPSLHKILESAASDKTKLKRLADYFRSEKIVRIVQPNCLNRAEEIPHDSVRLPREMGGYTQFSYSEMIDLGFFLLTQDCSFWERMTLPIYYALCGYRDSSSHDTVFAVTQRAVANKTSKAEGLDRYDAVISQIEDLFYRTDDNISERNGNDSISAHGAMTLMGLNILDSNMSLPNRSAMRQSLRLSLNAVAPRSDIAAGALATISYLSNAWLLNPSRAMMDDHINDMTERLEKAEEEKEAALAAKREAELQLEQVSALIPDLREQAEVSSKKAASLSAELDNTRREKQTLQEVADELLSAVEAYEDVDEGEEDVPVQFPASLQGKKVLSYGGFPVFVTGMRQCLPELIIRGPGDRPDKNIIKSCDIVFLQINRMSHSDFYYILDVCRENNIPYHTYRTNGVQRCAKQVLDTINDFA